jgi:hypothetical protein
MVANRFHSGFIKRRIRSAKAKPLFKPLRLQRRLGPVRLRRTRRAAYARAQQVRRSGFYWAAWRSKEARKAFLGIQPGDAARKAGPPRAGR